MATTKHMTRISKTSDLVLIVAGGSEFRDKVFVWGSLDMAHRKRTILRIVHGNIPGAELLAAEWAERVGVESVAFPADWRRLEETAGMRRNAQVLIAHKPDGVIIFPGSVFGDDLARRAAAACVPVWSPIPRV